MTVDAKVIRVFVQIESQKEIEVEIRSETISVAQLKASAGVPGEFALAIRKGDRITALRDDQVIELKEGEHFVAIPNGTVS